jgi:hypothetical protein
MAVTMESVFFWNFTPFCVVDFSTVSATPIITIFGVEV